MTLSIRSSALKRGVTVASFSILGALAAAGLRAQPAANQTPPAQPVARVAGPTRVAVVDAAAVLKALTETKDLQTRLEARLADARKQVEDVQAQIKKINADLELKKDKTAPDARDLAAKAYVLATQDRATRDALGQLIDEENGASVRTIYLKILDATQRVAARDHWDLVLSDDRSLIPPETIKDANGRERPITGSDVTRFAEQRQVLAASPGIDITQDVITQMNNEYAKIGKK
jgi:Skp family chaperone for outer membrane proteins